VTRFKRPYINWVSAEISITSTLQLRWNHHLFRWWPGRVERMNLSGAVVT
jgi:hypothetical protein